MSRFKKHLGEGKTITIDEEEFLIKPLTTDEAPLFFRLMRLANKDGSFDIMNMDEKTEDTFKTMLNMTLQKSFPTEWDEDQDELKAFGLKYMMKLFEAIVEVNQPAGNDEQKEKVAMLKERIGPK